LETLAERIVDADKPVRIEFQNLFRSTILPILPPEALGPFLPIIMAQLCGCAGHAC
jgi:pre-rRNA-processing protein IPI1